MSSRGKVLESWERPCRIFMILLGLLLFLTLMACEQMDPLSCQQDSDCFQGEVCRGGTCALSLHEPDVEEGQEGDPDSSEVGSDSGEGDAQDGGDGANQDEDQGIPYKIRRVVGGVSHTCVINQQDRVECWGDASQGQKGSPNGKFISLSAEGNTTCGILKDESVKCWGMSWDDEDLEDAGVGARVISFGGFHLCSLSQAGALRCAGGQSDFIDEAINSGEEFIDISVEWDNICGLNRDGEVSCWGRERGMSDNRPRRGGFVSVGVGGNHACALDEEGHIICWWGEDPASPNVYDYGQLDTPGGEFISLSVSGSHSCALRADQTIQCWGKEPWDEPEHFYFPPDKNQKFQEVVAGGFHNCGVTLDDEVICWGQNDEGQTSVPDGLKVQGVRE